MRGVMGQPSSLHIRPKLDLSLRVRTFVTVDETVSPYLSERACAEALPIVLVQIAAMGMAVTVPITNIRFHSVGMTDLHPRALDPNRCGPLTQPGAPRATYRRGRSC